MYYVIIGFCICVILLAAGIAGRLIYQRLHKKSCGGGCLHCPFAQSCQDYLKEEENPPHP